MNGLIYGALRRVMSRVEMGERHGEGLGGISERKEDEERGGSSVH